MRYAAASVSLAAVVRMATLSLSAASSRVGVTRERRERPRPVPGWVEAWSSRCQLWLATIASTASRSGLR